MFFFHLEVNAGFRAHFPALFEPVPDAAANSEESEVEDRRPEDKDDEREAATSVEVQIGRKLREMGDHFQREHLHLVRTTSDWLTFKCKHVIQEGKQGSQVLQPRLWFSPQRLLSRRAVTSFSVVTALLNMQTLQ